MHCYYTVSSPPVTEGTEPESAELAALTTRRKSQGITSAEAQPKVYTYLHVQYSFNVYNLVLYENLAVQYHCKYIGMAKCAIWVM